MPKPLSSPKAVDAVPITIYEDVQLLHSKYRRHFLQPNGTGAEEYVFADFLESARSIITSESYHQLSRLKSHASVHENISELSRAMPMRKGPPRSCKGDNDSVILPFERYQKTAAIIAKTASYAKVKVELYSETKHCVRCHETYKQDDLGRCKIPHVMCDEPRERRNWDDNYTIYDAVCCGFTIRGDCDGCFDEKILATNLCADELHTDDTREVQKERRRGYNDVNIFRCIIVNGKCHPELH